MYIIRKTVTIDSKRRITIPKEIIQELRDVGEFVFFFSIPKSDYVCFSFKDESGIETTRSKISKDHNRFRIIVPEELMDSSSFFYSDASSKKSIELVFSGKQVKIYPFKKRDDSWGSHRA